MPTLKENLRKREEIISLEKLGEKGNRRIERVKHNSPLKNYCWPCYWTT